MVNIFAYRDQRVNSRACYLPDKPQTVFCLANIAAKQKNNADFSIAIDEKLTLLQSLVSAARLAEITIYNQQQLEEREELIATDIVVSTNLPCCMTEITSYPRQPGYQYHARIVDANKKHYPTNRLSMEKYSIVIDPAKNRQMGAETRRLIVAKPLNSDPRNGAEPKTTPNPLLADDGSAWKSVSREMVKPTNLSLIAQATLASELNSAPLAEQDNHLAIASNNHLATDHIVYPGAIWPILTAPTTARQK